MTEKSYRDLVREAKTRIQEITPSESVALQAGDGNALFVDVREPNEWNLGHIPGALHIPRGILEQNIEAVAQRDARIILYCASGNRTALAADTLQQMGYTNVASLVGGFRGWVEAGGEIEG
ncbi:MAG TPA: rhodanese-like domain-containing protein [Gemmatimonadaceae bacterium]|nr:rhodanese-like domain-containing protein [Gemmatimonadaceae bacterium]